MKFVRTSIVCTIAKKRHAAIGECAGGVAVVIMTVGNVRDLGSSACDEGLGTKSTLRSRKRGLIFLQPEFHNIFDFLMKTGLPYANISNSHYDCWNC